MPCFERSHQAGGIITPYQAITSGMFITVCGAIRGGLSSSRERLMGTPGQGIGSPFTTQGVYEQPSIGIGLYQ